MRASRLCLAGAMCISMTLAMTAAGIAQSGESEATGTPDRTEILAEWNQMLESHPGFARALILQQAILIEASGLGSAIVDPRMCRALEAGIPMVFEGFWSSQCPELSNPPPAIGGIIDCLSDSSRDPAGCLETDDWVDDPLASGG